MVSRERTTLVTDNGSARIQATATPASAAPAVTGDAPAHNHSDSWDRAIALTVQQARLNENAEQEGD